VLRRTLLEFDDLPSVWSASLRYTDKLDYSKRQCHLGCGSVESSMTSQSVGC